LEGRGVEGGNETQAEYKHGFSPSCGFEIVWEAFLFLADRGDSTGFVRAEGAARPGKRKHRGNCS